MFYYCVYLINNLNKYEYTEDKFMALPGPKIKPIGLIYLEMPRRYRYLGKDGEVDDFGSIVGKDGFHGNDKPIQECQLATSVSGDYSWKPGDSEKFTEVPSKGSLNILALRVHLGIIEVDNFGLVGDNRRKYEDELRHVKMPTQEPPVEVFSSSFVIDNFEKFDLSKVKLI